MSASRKVVSTLNYETFFVGQFYFVTLYSIFRIKVIDLVTSPEVMKMAIKQPGKKNPMIPVAGILQGGFYVAITSQGLFKYNMVNHQRAPLSEPPKRLEELGKSRRAMHAFPPVGLFFDRSDADSCFEGLHNEVFDPNWESHTKKVLLAIGQEHPLITISTEGELAVPKWLYTPLEVTN